MALRVQVSARAAEQVQRAADWWAANRLSAPGTIAADFGESVAQLAEQPGIGTEYEGSRTPGVRRLYLSRVRYFIHYIAAAGELRITCVLARKQRPSSCPVKLTHNTSIERAVSGGLPPPTADHVERLASQPSLVVHR